MGRLATCISVLLIFALGVPSAMLARADERDDREYAAHKAVEREAAKLGAKVVAEFEWDVRGTLGNVVAPMKLIADFAGSVQKVCDTYRTGVEKVQGGVEATNKMLDTLKRSGEWLAKHAPDNPESAKLRAQVEQVTAEVNELPGELKLGQISASARDQINRLREKMGLSPLVVKGASTSDNTVAGNPSEPALVKK